jgi:lipopolysaccharide biosynthesis regulator YciM
MRWRRRRRAERAEQGAAAQLRNALHHVLAGDLAAAEIALSETARLDSSSSDVYLALANVYRARGEIGRAIQIHQNLLLRPELPALLRREALLGIALDFRTGGFLARSRASFEELLEIEPRNEQALRALEQIHVEEGEWEAALRVRRRIGRRDRETRRIQAHLWTGLGRARAEAGDESEARRAFRRALGRDRRCAEAYLELAEQRMREGQPQGALGYLKRTLDLHPEIGRIVFARLLRAAQAAGDLEGLESLLRERLEERSGDRELVLEIARVQMAREEPDAAIAQLERLCESAPGWRDGLAELGRAQLRAGRDADALKTLSGLLQLLTPARSRLQCAGCGALSDELHWRCPTCGSWDSF